MEQVLDQIRTLVLGVADAAESTSEPAAAEPTPETVPAAVPATAPEVASGQLPAGASGADVPGWVRAALRCPDCGGELHDVDAALQCTDCGRVHAVEGGIPVLIAGRAEAPSAD